jgi:hypothetical protein
VQRGSRQRHFSQNGNIIDGEQRDALFARGRKDGPIPAAPFGDLYEQTIFTVAAHEGAFFCEVERWHVLLLFSLKVIV